MEIIMSSSALGILRPLVKNSWRPAASTAATLMLALLVAGCAQQREPGFYTGHHDSTLADAELQAQGRTGARAAPQIQLGFGETGEAENGQAQQAGATLPTTLARPLSEARTFLGTVPCAGPAGGCSANRVTLTFAPSGEWRGRTVILGASSPTNDIIEQGCWSVSGLQPLRVLLQLKNENTKANLTFVNDNVLRVNTINEIEPTLDYHLTRQADVDPIDELGTQTTLQCNKQS
jgi:hypothetical protein